MPKKGEVNFSPEEIKREKIKKLNDSIVLEANRADQLKKKYNAQKKYDPYDVLKKEVDAFKTDPRSVKIMDHAKNRQRPLIRAWDLSKSKAFDNRMDLCYTIRRCYPDYN